VQPALVGVMKLIMQVQIPFCCFRRDGEGKGEDISSATIESTIIKIRVSTYFWQRSQSKHSIFAILDYETEIAAASL